MFYQLSNNNQTDQGDDTEGFEIEGLEVIYINERDGLEREGMKESQ
jgi:hypothetical protein